MVMESLPTFTKPARQRWESIPADIRQRLLSNVWCGRFGSHRFITCQVNRELDATGPWAWKS